MAVATGAGEQHLAWEARSRPRGLVVAAIGAICALAGPILALTVVQRGLPLVGVVQALTPALRGQAEPTVDPRVPELVLLHNHAASDLLSTALTCVELIALGAVLWLLYRATRARLPKLPPWGSWAVLIAPILAGLVTLAIEIAFQSKTSSFLSGSDRSQAATQAVFDTRRSGASVGAAVATQLATAAAIIWVSLQALRAGLLTRFMGILGSIIGVLFVLPFLPFDWALEAIWLGGLALLFAGRWPGGQPPAWLSGRAEPWPSRREMYEQRVADRNRAEARAIRDKPAASEEAAAAAAPRPVPRSKANRRKRRKGR